ncbi:MAG: hypothetical protein KJ667_09945 [Alphaproteobacteria bacterium]|nr:hypothetical protein [Alphaproteobacteria bacterium]
MAASPLPASFLVNEERPDRLQAVGAQKPARTGGDGKLNPVERSRNGA